MPIVKRVHRLKKIFKRKRFFLHTPTTIYKIVWSSTAGLIKKEFTAAVETRHPACIWRPHGAFFEKRISLLERAFVCSSERLARPATSTETDSFIQSLIDSVPEGCPSRPWNEIFDRDRFRIVWDGLSRHQRDSVLAILDGVTVAVTGAHGDFRDRHVFIDRAGDFKVIDWEYYQRNGSLACDILRLYSRRYGASQGTSYLNPELFKTMGFPIVFSSSLFGNKTVPGLEALSMLAAFEYACTPNGNTYKRVEHLNTHVFAESGPEVWNHKHVK